MKHKSKSPKEVLALDPQENDASKEVTNMGFVNTNKGFSITLKLFYHIPTDFVSTFKSNIQTISLAMVQKLL